ncbi:MAG: lytic murein transglycosylase [Thiobacillus sp.]|nr:lytic murein transglycosylase [Thiobacillus sp.]MDP2056473.1 lytic murein transglycosylase [Thiobacillus sp.]
MRKLFLLLAVLAAFSAHAQTGFDSWLAAFRQDAEAQGISAATLDAALTGITPVERVVELDGRQPEFLQTFADYLGRRVTADQVARGQALMTEHATLLDAAEQQYGIPKAVLVAFWGLETHYGTVLGSLNIPASLATLAFEGRRSDFFRSQLLDALRIIDAGHVDAVDMNGSWAGAMGHMQFMPSTFRAYAVDGDGDARIDLWQSLPDAMHSAANYLKRAGWRAGEPVAIEVRLPEGFDWQRGGVHRLPVAEWMALGVQTVDATTLPAVTGCAAIVLPQGWQGPAFMVFDNFDVVMRWNRSVNYALAVAQLAQLVAGGGALVAPAGEVGALGTAQLKTLQQALNEMGFDVGTADGLLGPRTQTAIRRYQVVHDLPADGYPAPSVLAHVEQTHAAAAVAGKLILAPAPTFAESTSQPDSGE